MKLILLFALAASTALVVDSNGEAESFRNLKPRIVGGDEASLGEYPYFGKRKLHESRQHVYALRTSLTTNRIRFILIPPVFFFALALSKIQSQSKWIMVGAVEH